MNSTFCGAEEKEELNFYQIFLKKQIEKLININ